MDFVPKSGGEELRGRGLVTRHWAPWPRRHPSVFPVMTTGYMPRKDHWVRHRFQTCNYSFILSGRGEYRLGGRVWKVEGPSVLMQWPSVVPEYGPEPGGGTWEELFITYPARSMARLRAAGLFRADRPCWRVRETVGLQEKLEELARLAADAAGGEGSADRVDRVCEALILESVLAESRAEPDAVEAAVRRILRGLRQNFSTRMNWEAVARAEGLSYSTFRRRWQEVVGMPPSAMQERLRMRAACQMLVETRRTVAEVAEACGFEDALYFSRRFRAAQGMPPREYRGRHRGEGPGRG